MGKHVKLGDRLEVVFASAYRGAQTQELINGRRAFATESGPTPVAGDRWEVMVVGMNPSRTVYFVEPLNFVDAADGLGDLLRPHAPYYHEFIRESESDLNCLLSLIGLGEGPIDPGFLDEAAKDILDHCPLPDSYRTAAFSRFQEQRVLASTYQGLSPHINFLQ